MFDIKTDILFKKKKRYKKEKNKKKKICFFSANFIKVTESKKEDYIYKKRGESTNRNRS